MLGLSLSEHDLLIFIQLGTCLGEMLQCRLDLSGVQAQFGSMIGLVQRC